MPAHRCSQRDEPPNKMFLKVRAEQADWVSLHLLGHKGQEVRCSTKPPAGSELPRSSPWACCPHSELCAVSHVLPFCAMAGLGYQHVSSSAPLINQIRPGLPARVLTRAAHKPDPARVLCPISTLHSRLPSNPLHGSESSKYLFQ